MPENSTSDLSIFRGSLRLTYLNPFRYILVIIRGIFLKGVGMDVLWPQYVALTILGLAVFTAAVLRFHKRLD